MMIRARYIKKGDLAFLSHLDLVRFFERAFRRAKVPLAFTQGFNPHPIIAFAAPLSVGVNSEAEYVDVVLSEPIEPQTFTAAMNEVLPQNIQVLDAVLLNEKTSIALMQEAALMEYELTCTLENAMTLQAITELIHHFMDQPEVFVEKKGKAGDGRSNQRFGKKKKLNRVNIIPYLDAFTIQQFEGRTLKLRLTIKVQDQATIKPLLIFKRWVELYEVPTLEKSLQIERKEIYKLDENKGYVPMMG